MAPGVGEQGRWFLCSLGVGFGLGAVYWFLAALRHRFPGSRVLADAVFLGLFAWSLGWVALVVGKGRYGMPQLLGLAMGAALWRVTLGPALGRLFYRFWDGLGHLGRLLLMPVKTLSKKTKKITKNLFSTWKKWVTIDVPWRRVPKRSPTGRTTPKPQKKHNRKP